MKKFDKIAEEIYRTLLEAPAVPAAPAQAAQGAPATPAAGLPQDGGPVQAEPVAATQADRSPAETKNWETTLLDLASKAIVNVKNNPNSVDVDMEQLLTVPTTLQTKDQRLDALKTLAGEV